jgi:hypothetical protein
MDPVEIEREIDRELRRLPAPRAPRTLAPRVMRAIAVAPPAAAAAGWRTWPVAWQWVSLAVLASAGCAAAWVWSAAAAWLSAAVSSPVEPWSLPSLVTSLQAAAISAGIIWRAFLAPIAGPAIGIVTVMCTACGLLGAALRYVAWEGQRTSHS